MREACRCFGVRFFAFQLSALAAWSVRGRVSYSPPWREGEGYESPFHEDESKYLSRARGNPTLVADEQDIPAATFVLARRHEM